MTSEGAWPVSDRLLYVYIVFRVFLQGIEEHCQTKKMQTKIFSKFESPQVTTWNQPTLTVHDRHFPFKFPRILTLHISISYICKCGAVFLLPGCMSLIWDCRPGGSFWGWLTCSVHWNRCNRCHGALCLPELPSRKPHGEGNFSQWFQLRERPQQHWQWVFNSASLVHVNNLTNGHQQQGHRSRNISADHMVCTPPPVQIKKASPPPNVGHVCTVWVWVSNRVGHWCGASPHNIPNQIDRTMATPSLCLCPQPMLLSTITRAV